MSIYSMNRQYNVSQEQPVFSLAHLPLQSVFSLNMFSLFSIIVKTLCWVKYSVIPVRMAPDSM